MHKRRGARHADTIPLPLKVSLAPVLVSFLFPFFAVDFLYSVSLAPTTD
jgi:hypothetical protein